MKKAQKKQAENFLKLLKEANDQIRKMIDNRNIVAVLELLEGCQNGAISLGNLIEKSEGEGFVTVSMLEEYCELVYQIYEKLAGGQTVDAHKIYKSLKTVLLRIEQSVKYDITARTEAVFLPYKASMWDSLESVWRAANEDPNCDAYVIPIPYYDKNKDGTFGEFHYEGDLYPDYVPITSYEQFDFATNRPDMIFIHNPYDDYNIVTSVHPFFYSDNLKQYTDKLVYIPYFILEDIDLKDKDVMEGMSRYIQTKGVMNADVVVVQSENMRRCYIENLTKIVGENGKRELETKILGLGSPKLDKVLNTNAGNVNLPEAWRNVIEKKDGSRKKVILYNTSLSAFLQDSDNMLKKMESVFQTFRENKDEVALLWRPHPLMQATIKSMRPQLWQDYKKLVQKYKDDGFGIYDDSADLDRAIAISDGYYGNRSSVVYLYQLTHKPIMLDV